jgi:hypothetical protein
MRLAEIRNLVSPPGSYRTLQKLHPVEIPRAPKSRLDELMRGRIYIENGSHIGQFPFRLVPLLAGFVSPRAISCWRANSSSWMRDAVAARYSRQWCASSAILGRAASSTIAPLRTITSTARSKISDTLVSMSAQRHQLPSPETGRGELRDQRMLTIAGGGTRGIVWVFPAPAGMNRSTCRVRTAPPGVPRACGDEPL